MLLPLSSLNIMTSSYYSLTREPTVSQIAVPSLAGVIPTVTPLDRCHAQQFTTSRLPKLTLPSFSGNLLDWLTFWDSFQAAIHLNPNLSRVQKFNYLKAKL